MQRKSTKRHTDYIYMNKNYDFANNAQNHNKTAQYNDV